MNLKAVITPPEKPKQSFNDPSMKAESVADQYEQDVNNSVARWVNADEIYYGRERDLQNYPTFKLSRCHPKVRMGVFPDSWFHPFYSKTGVTGPYMFMFGSFMFLINKEIWLFDGHFLECLVFFGMSTVIIKKAGPYARKFLDECTQEDEQVMYHKPINEVKSYLDNTIKTCEVEVGRTTAVSEHVRAKEENIALQLEATYRERLQKVYRAVHRRLDYHVEWENTRKRYIQQHMVNWVVDHVVKGITPAQEKETLAHCINELERLAQNSKVTTPV
nr:SJCHGC09031 protein [Schistosoma japonicum]CAX73873.1 ATP synthase, subunit b [Schistosoma japonicum]